MSAQLGDEDIVYQAAHETITPMSLKAFLETVRLTEPRFTAEFGTLAGLEEKAEEAAEEGAKSR